jgi:hypothetical protein
MSVEACVWILVVFLCAIFFVCLVIFSVITLLQIKEKERFIKCDLKEHCELKTEDGFCYSDNKVKCIEVPEAFKIK